MNILTDFSSCLLLLEVALSMNLTKNRCNFLMNSGKKEQGHKDCILVSNCRLFCISK